MFHQKCIWWSQLLRCSDLLLFFLRNDGRLNFSWFSTFLKFVFLCIHEASCFRVASLYIFSSFSRERSISGTPWGNFITSGTNVHPRTKWLEFEGRRSPWPHKTHFFSRYLNNFFFFNTLIMTTFYTNV